ncbi:MAG: hypothetical protein R8K49_00825 [Mariprofundaceae bacterium]
MRHSKQVKISIPSSDKEEVSRLGAILGMDSSGYVRYLMYDAIKTNRLMNTIPTMKNDTFFKFKAPIELVEHIKQQAISSNISMGSFIRALIHEKTTMAFK